MTRKREETGLREEERLSEARARQGQRTSEEAGGSAHAVLLCTIHIFPPAPDLPPSLRMQSKLREEGRKEPSNHGAKEKWKRNSDSAAH